MIHRIGVGIEITGLAIAIINLALEALEVKIPHQLGYVLLVLAGIMFAGGCVFVFWDNLKHFFNKYSFQSPIKKKMEATQSQQQIVRQQTSYSYDKGDATSIHVIKHLESVKEQLGVLTGGAYASSVKQIFNNILNDSDFNTWFKMKNWTIPLTKSFNLQLDQLFERYTKYREIARVSNVRADNISAMTNETRSLILDYRNIVSDFIQLLNIFEKEGAPLVWEREPISNRVYQDLRDGYDELMLRVKNLKVYVNDANKSLLPSDDQLTKFDRIPGIIHL
jgi:hypothetical protein